MKRPTWLTKEVIGWTAFDFANQAFTMVIITALYQQYFINHVVPATDGSHRAGHQLWALSNMAAEAIIIITSPFLGALADFSGAKKLFLFATYIGSVVATLALGLIGPGDVAMGTTLFILGYVFFGAGENFLNAFLPEIASHKDMGRVSAFSWAVAYTGALLSTAVAYTLLSAFGEGATGYRVVAVWCGVYFLLGGIPTFLLLRERKLRESLPSGQTMATVGFYRLAQTFRDLRRYRQLMRFMLIVMIYMAGMQVVIFYAGSIAKDVFEFSNSEQGVFFAQVIVTGIIGAAITGRVQDRIGSRTTILGLLLIWAVTILLAGFATRPWLFWVLGNFVGFSMGALGSASRVMAGLFSPQHKAGEFFGFYGMAQKVAAFLGLGFQYVLSAQGVDFNVSIAASAIFFVVGFVLMFAVNEKEGRITAIRAAREHIRKHKDYAGELPVDPVAPIE